MFSHIAPEAAASPDGSAPSTRHRQVLIAGGGIGGLLAAVGLARQGLDVTVLERAADFGEIGAGLQLAPNATRVLRKLGLLDRVVSAGVLPRRLVLADAVSLTELTSLDVTDFDRRYGGPYLVVHRADLLAVLLEACRAEPSIELRPGKDVVRVEEPDPRSVLVTCADGSTFAGDILVGADGLHSRVRTLIEGSAPLASGYVAYRGAVPTETVLERFADRDVVAFLGVGMHFVQYPLRGGSLYNQVAVFRSERFLAGEDDWGGPDELDLAFSGVHDRIRSALVAIDRGAYWQMFDREPMDTWTHGRAVLLGDAAHPMLQYLAQGACQAIQDGDCLAYALGNAHATGRDLADGFAEYERHRLEWAGRVQRNARIWGDIWHSDGVARVLMDAYMRERDPLDHRHVTPLYGTPPTCGHSEPGAAAASHSAPRSPDGVGSRRLTPTSPTTK